MAPKFFLFQKNRTKNTKKIPTTVDRIVPVSIVIDTLSDRIKELVSSVTEEDTVCSIGRRSQLSHPPELLVACTLVSFSLMQQREVSGVLDTGAGASYIIGTSPDLPLLPLEKPWKVRFADGSTVSLNQYFKGILQVKASHFGDESSTAISSDVTLLVIPAPNTEPYLILGRDMFRALGITVDSSLSAHIGDAIVYKSPDTTLWERHDNLFECHECMDLPEIPTTLVVKFKPESDAPLGRAYVEVPWKSALRPSANLSSTRARDIKTMNRLNADEKNLYWSAISTMIDGKFVSRISEITDGHYISIRPVINSDRTTTKCRLCLDARAINEFTHQGPQLGRSILEVLMMFRTSPAVGTFDLSKAFWQIKLPPADRKWYRTMVDGRPLQFNCLVFGANYSPAALEIAIRNIHSRALQHITANSIHPGEPPRPCSTETLWYNYVDDFVVREEDAEKLKKKIKWIRWFFTNHGFPSGKECSSRSTSDTEQSDTCSYLGYRWEPESDRLDVQDTPLPLALPQARMNRAEVASLLLKLFDPLGLRLRLQLAGRMILREAFTETTSKSDHWRTDVSEEVRSKLMEWSRAVRETQANDTWPTPRFVDTSTLLVFCDASTSAWAVSCYSGLDFTHLMSRGGLTKPKSSIPRAELDALDAALELTCALPLLDMGVVTVRIFTDNEPNVHRLRNQGNDKHLPQYELRRVQRIRQRLDEICTRHPNAWIQTIPGVLNLADAPTRPWPPSAPSPLIDMSALSRELLRPDPYAYRSSSTEFGELLLGYMSLRSQSQKTLEPTLLPVSESTSTPIDTPTNPNSEWTERIRENQKLLDPARYSTRNADGLLVTDKNKIILHASDRELLQTLMSNIHGDHHYGIQVMVKLLRQKYYWKNFHTDCHTFVKGCSTCSRLRFSHKLRTALGDNSKWISTVNKLGLGSVVGADVCEMTSVDGFDCFITVTCAVSKWVRAVPLTGQTALEITKPLEDLFLSSLVPRVLVTDGAPVLKSRRFTAFCDKWSITHLVFPPSASPYHGWVERPHKLLLDTLRLLHLDYPGHNWVDLLPLAQYLVNSRPYDPDDESGLNPLHVVYNSVDTRDMNIEACTEVIRDAGLSHLIFETPADYTARGERSKRKQEGITKQYLQWFAKRRSDVQARLKKQAHDMRHPAFPVGSQVMIYRPPTSKVSTKLTGPCEITAITSSTTRRVRRPDGREVLESITNLIPHQPSIVQ
jgi:hypothetical protein